MPDLILGKDPFRTPFEQAVKNLEARIPRGLSQEQLDRIGTGQAKPQTSAHWNWHDTLAHQHADAFVVAKMAQVDLLKSVHASLVRAQEQGQAFAKWQKNITPELQTAGWWGKKEVLNPKTGKMELAQLGSPRRLRIIYRTNMRVNMMAGHYKNLMAASQSRPLWRYVARMDNKTRPSHAALHNLVFRFDHPFWNTHFPPNGWECRCTVVSETDTSLKRLSREILDLNKSRPKGEQEPAPTIVDMTDVPTIEQHPLPGGPGPLPNGVREKTVPVATFRGMRPDPGWSYNPGQMPWVRETMLADRIRELPQPIARAALDQMARKDYSQWSAFATAAKQQVGQIKGVQYQSGKALDSFAIRWIDSSMLDAFNKALGVSLEPFLATDVQGAEHAVRDNKNTRIGSGSRLIPWDEYLKLPAHLENALVYLDRDTKDAIIYASPLGKDLIKTVFRVESRDGRQTLKLVTSGIVKSNAFADKRRWSLIRTGKG